MVVSTNQLATERIFHGGLGQYPDIFNYLIRRQAQVEEADMLEAMEAVFSDRRPFIWPLLPEAFGYLLGHTSAKRWTKTAMKLLGEHYLPQQEFAGLVARLNEKIPQEPLVDFYEELLRRHEIPAHGYKIIFDYLLNNVRDQRLPNIFHAILSQAPINDKNARIVLHTLFQEAEEWVIEGVLFLTLTDNKISQERHLNIFNTAISMIYSVILNESIFARLLKSRQAVSICMFLCWIPSNITAR